MSHFTTVKTEINDLDCLKRSLGKRGVAFREDAVVRGYAGQTTRAAVVIDTGRGYDVGVQADGTMVADWWGVETYSGKSEREVVGGIVQGYAVERVITSCAAEGYNVDPSQITVETDGTVQLLAVKWG